MNRILYFSATIALMMALPAAAVAACHAFDQVREHLSETYHETTVWVGMRPDGYQIVIIGAPGGGTFTVLRLSPDGAACVLASGVGWVALDAQRHLLGEES